MIQCKNIAKIYKSGKIKTYALRNASFKINNNEFVAVMGPSGSGKSTLMHIIGCLDMPTKGEYLLNNKDVSKLSDNELAHIRMKNIGFVFQAYNLLPRATVLRNVCLPLVYAGVSRAKREKQAKNALQDAGLEESHFNHLSNQLSGGQMQRVAIARALVNDPGLILADEPTGNLDTKTGKMVLETFQRLHKEQGRTIILITHEQYVAEHAQRIIYIRDGNIVQDKKVKNQRVINNHSLV